MIDKLLSELRKNSPHGAPHKPMEPPKCWNCGKPGHLQMRCTDGNKKRSEQKCDDSPSNSDEENRNQ